MAADSLDLHGWVAPCFRLTGGKSRREGVAELYDVLLSLFTHFLPLGPIVLIALAVAFIVAIAPKQASD